MSDSTPVRRLLRASPIDDRTRPIADAAAALTGIALSPVYLAAAAARGTPGISFRVRCSAFGLRQLFAVRNRLSLREIYQTVTYPMDSLRYFEFDFAWRCISGLAAKTYLDVSSPRLLPLLFVRENESIRPVLLNPDRRDLPVTMKFARAMAVERRCRFVEDVITAVDLHEESIDLVTSLSVLEHIPDDREAVRCIWNLLRPGGRLILTVPCAAVASEEYIDRDEYGLLHADNDGFVFWQRYYDVKLLQERIFSTTGTPSTLRVYGERRAGSYARNVDEKMRDRRRYRFWREPYMMAAEYRHFDSIDELPGMGVVGMEFRKN
jgi:SAM-dependent methyltransferase